jgi:hypothetical protein
MSDYPPLGRFVTQRLNAEKRDVTKSQEPDEYSAVYPRTARAVVEKYPELTEFERRAVLASLIADADLMTRRTNQDQTRRLVEVSEILALK